MEVQGDLTVELLFKPNSSNLGSNSDVVTLVQKRNSSSTGSFLSAWNVSFRPDSGVLRAGVGYGSGTGDTLTGTTDIRDGEWHHVAMVIDRDYNATADDRFRLYVDGVMEDEIIKEMPDLFYGTLPFEIGAGNYSGDTSPFRRNVNGRIDDVIYAAEARSTGTFTALIPEPSTFSLIFLTGLLFHLQRTRRNKC